ncbi:hypothetical protein [Streptomyces lasiicapitis]|uniref:Uncharacterized protein n=1 Tax=Streptomyces lasiicapitis TaxID=1923961 RepID=A0ABQ2LKL7_9ACTN|nr:hypothetical protein [Streptomyces lasiicapitis]GGO34794.1 hypothetical protein GCM10012286_04440 [Streptomyces lasiicapitis]
MGLFDKLTGTKRPIGNVTPRPVEDVRTALLGLNRPNIPWVVREGEPDRTVLVAEWRLMEPAWRDFFVRRQLSLKLRVTMRLAANSHEVRALEEQWKITWVGNPPMPSASEYGRGPSRTVYRQGSIGRGGNGRVRSAGTTLYDTADFKDPLRNTVLRAGWVWRGVLFGKV